MNDTILEMRNICKAYPGVMALDSVSLDVRRGEIHALIGENGAGKSTLIKVLSGAETANSGEIMLEGECFAGFTPLEAIGRGISVIYQELNLAPNLTVAENIFLGHEKRKGPFVDKKRMLRETRKLLDGLNLDIDADIEVKNLTVAYQQMVEVVKAISRNAKILVMDEPTSPLSNKEVEILFAMIRRLREKGISIIYISHRMEEIFSISDRTTVMMDGKTVVTVDTAGTSRQELIRHMVGRELREVYPAGDAQQDEEVFALRGASNPYLKDISLSLRRGEILGIGGLVGAGRTELARMIFGADPMTGGEIMLEGRSIRITCPSDAIKHGIGLIPEDRKNEGLVLSMSIKHNISLSDLDNISQGGFLSEKRDAELSRHFGKALNIKAADFNFVTRKLSGGNQQKVVLAKWLATKCRVLIFDEPTRGIDVGAKLEIYNLMRELTRQGISIMMISSDMPELLGMSDRILVIHNKKIRALLNKNEFSQETVLEYASGGGYTHG